MLLDSYQSGSTECILQDGFSCFIYVCTSHPVSGSVSLTGYWNLNSPHAPVAWHDFLVIVSENSFYTTDSSKNTTKFRWPDPETRLSFHLLPICCSIKQITLGRLAALKVAAFVEISLVAKWIADQTYVVRSIVECFTYKRLSGESEDKWRVGVGWGW